MPESATASKKDAAEAGTANIAGTAAQRPPIYDGWEIDEQLRHVRRVLGSGPVPREELDESSQPKFRFDAGHGVPAPQLKQARRSSRKTEWAASAPEKHAPGSRVLAVLAWTTLLLGTTGSVCGLALIGWSMNTGRQDLWAIGTPIILAGQILLILGLVLELDRIWRDSRWAATRLETVDERLHDLQAATSLLGATQGPSNAFYAHWAGGAGPEILLGDLKGQLDLLAVKLSQK
ncbi:MAG: hypothetical protein ACLP9L_31400 [Thermoguttaceae bacterium]